MLQNMAGISSGTDFGDQPNFRNLKTKSTYYNDYKSRGLSPGFGQLGFISSLTINHNLENRESGVFEKLDTRTRSTVQNTILPKVIEVVVGFTPIHEHALGWENDKFKQELFPYGVTLYDAGQNKSDIEGGTWKQAAEAQENRIKLEQARQAADARYSGMFGKKGLFGGKGRLQRDADRLDKVEGEKGYIKNDAKRAYIAQAVQGQQMIDDGYGDAGGSAARDAIEVSEMDYAGLSSDYK